MRKMTEEDIITIRPHLKVVIGPLLVAICCSIFIGVGIAIVPLQYRPWGQYAVASLGVLALICLSIYPASKKMTTALTLSDDSLDVSEGLWGRRHLSVPINRIEQVEYRQNLAQRLCRAGDLHLHCISGRDIAISNLPDICALSEAITTLVTKTDIPRDTDEDSWDPYEISQCEKDGSYDVTELIDPSATEDEIGTEVIDIPLECADDSDVDLTAILEGDDMTKRILCSDETLHIHRKGDNPSRRWF